MASSALAWVHEVQTLAAAPLLVGELELAQDFPIGPAQVSGATPTTAGIAQL
jgi:hypothetical protein